MIYLNNHSYNKMKWAIGIVLCSSALALEITSVPIEEALADKVSVHIKGKDIQRKPFDDIIAKEYEVVKIHIKENFAYAKIGEYDIRSLIAGSLHFTKSIVGKLHEFDTDSYVYIKSNTKRDVDRVFKVSVDKCGNNNVIFEGIISGSAFVPSRQSDSQIACLGVADSGQNSGCLVVEIQNPLSIGLELYENDMDFFIQNKLKTKRSQCICCSFPQMGNKHLLPPQQKTRVFLKIDDDILKESDGQLYMYGVLRPEGGWGDIFEFVMPVVMNPFTEKHNMSLTFCDENKRNLFIDIGTGTYYAENRSNLFSNAESSPL